MGMIFGKIDVETPKYASVAVSGLLAAEQITLRRYPSQVTVRIAGDARVGDNECFKLLARYIGVYGTPQNTAGGKAAEKVAMTAPVLSDAQSQPISMTAPVLAEPRSTPVAMTAPVLSSGKSEKSEARRGAPMAFVLPSCYSSINDAPKPTDPRVVLEEIPERLVAVRTFSGLTSVKKATPMAEAMRALLVSEGFNCKSWSLARYNPPFTIPFLRTNEIWYEVEKGERKCVRK